METVTAHPSLSIADVAKLYGVSRNTIRRRIKDHTLKIYRLGPQVIRLDPQEVAAAFRSGCQ